MNNTRDVEPLLVTHNTDVHHKKRKREILIVINEGAAEKNMMKIKKAAFRCTISHFLSHSNSLCHFQSQYNFFSFNLIIFVDVFATHSFLFIYNIFSHIHFILICVPLFVNLCVFFCCFFCCTCACIN